MKISARDIDHLSIATPDPEALAIRLQQIGFNLTPEGVEDAIVMWCHDIQSDDYARRLEGLDQ